MWSHFCEAIQLERVGKFCVGSLRIIGRTISAGSVEYCERHGATVEKVSLVERGRADFLGDEGRACGSVLCFVHG